MLDSGPSLHGEQRLPRLTVYHSDAPSCTNTAILGEHDASDCDEQEDERGDELGNHRLAACTVNNTTGDELKRYDILDT